MESRRQIEQIGRAAHPADDDLEPALLQDDLRIGVKRQAIDDRPDAVLIDAVEAAESQQFTVDLA